MGAASTCSAKFHSHSFPVHPRAMHSLSPVRNSTTIAAIFRQCVTAVVTFAAVALFILAAAPVYYSGMVSAYLEAAPYIMVMPAD